MEEIFIEGDRVSYLEAGGWLRALDSPSTEEENRRLVERLVAATDRRLDASAPLAQARILDGTARLTAVIPPVADHLSATIRRYALRQESLSSMVSLDSITPAAAAFLRAAMGASASVIISGPPGAGKTSFLSALIAAVPAEHCIRACEEVRELHVPLVHGSYFFDWTTGHEVAWRRNYQRWMRFINDYKNAGGRVTAGASDSSPCGPCPRVRRRRATRRGARNDR